MTVGDRDRCRDVLGPVREADRGRGAALDARVAGVERQLERLGPDAVDPDRGRQIVQQDAIARALVRSVLLDCRRLPMPLGTLGRTATSSREGRACRDPPVSG
jgi:hypothetical protein